LSRNEKLPSLSALIPPEGSPLQNVESSVLTSP
jgi:hypothetical protein